MVPPTLTNLGITVRHVAGVPSAPTGLSATIDGSNKRNIDFSFSAPSSNGGGSLTYSVYSVPSAGNSPVTTSSTSAEWQGASDYDGVAFKFYVVAHVRFASSAARSLVCCCVRHNMPATLVTPLDFD